MICIVFILSFFPLLLLKFNNGFEFLELFSEKENILNIMPLNVNASLEANFYFF